MIRAILLTGIGVAAAIVATMGSKAWLTVSNPREDTPPLGRLVEVDGRRSHLICAGEGSPTVIFEGGLPGDSLAWMSVLPQVAEFTRACAYDRPGYGWSEPATTQRTAETMVHELRSLLQNADIAPPYVLVGHSFGGLLSQLYATRFPDEVHGAVLVDSAHPERVHRSLSLREIEGVSLAIRILRPLKLAGFVLPVPAGDPASRDSKVRQLEAELLMSDQTLREVVREMSALRQNLQDVKDSNVSFGDKPLVVLTEGVERDEGWYSRQEDLARLSTNSEWRVVDGAGHHIQHDNPDAVIEAVRRVVAGLPSPADDPAP